MTYTLLTMVQASATELGLPVPSAVASATDAQTRQMLGLLNREGRFLVRDHQWSQLQTLGTITAVADQAAYNFPSDFLRIIGNTLWDRQNRWELLGPDSPQTDRFKRESAVSQTGPRRSVRQVGSQLKVWPTPTSSGAVFVYEYVSKNWATTSTGTGIDAMTADTDIPLLDADLLVLGLKWRFLAAKGMGSAEAVQAEYSDALRKAKAANNGGGRILSMVPRHKLPNNADIVAGSRPNVILSEGGDFLTVE